MFNVQNLKQKTFQRMNLSLAELERVLDRWEVKPVLDYETDQEAPVKRRSPLHLSTLREWIRRVHNKPEATGKADDCPPAAAESVF